ncbi:hypothetical protein C1645_736632 [Glomus cerebriforme]|uniref:Uncharacterized protein n=1 Tax=Glomus cerebriforme TaxID=658196 RepID=A0A397TAS8_9GLOM|nr:hypothetical protein C1645_736632 [Glomus cerebriforme]
MTATYAEVVRKENKENKENSENYEADVITNAQKISIPTSNATNSKENEDATLLKKGEFPKNKEVNGSIKIAGDLKKTAEERDESQQRTRGSNEVSKRSKGVIFFTVAIDIALAGLLVGTIYKKPTINKVKLGFGTVGLSLFYGFQWFFYQKHSD